MLPKVNSFIAKVMEDMQSIAQDSINDCLKGKEFHNEKVEEWCTTIVKRILENLNEKETPKYKFITNCMILTPFSQCIHESQMALWDTTYDAKITTKWANESIKCIVSIWAFRTRFEA